MHRDAGDEAWAALGARLRARGLNERALRHCFGVSCPCHAPLAARSTLGRSLPDAPAIVPPAALLAHLFVAGAPVAADAARRLLGDDLDHLEACELVTVAGGAVSARVTLLPVGEALVASDRADRLLGRDVVACADDSAFHTIGMVPARAQRPGMRWLDVGTGGAIIPLARPGAAHRVLATDVHPRAVSMARLGIALSGRRDITAGAADLLDGAGQDGPWDRITFNAPIPSFAAPVDPDTPLYHLGADDILERFWRDVRHLVAPAGEVIVHSWQPVEHDLARLDVPGRITVLRYTPPGQAPAFGVTVWQPDAPPARRLVHVALSPASPHVSRLMLDEPVA